MNDVGGDPLNSGEQQAKSREILPFVLAIVIAIVAVVVVAGLTGKQVSNVFSNISNGLFVGSG